MSMLKKVLLKTKLRTLTLLAPKRAGKLATELFIKSRNQSNPYRKAFTPMGARAVPIYTDNGKVKQAYLWGGDDGDIVLLVHGWGADCASMFSFVPYLQRAGYRVATFDAPAHGSSEGEFASMMEYQRACEQVIRQLGPVTKIISHSLGGIIATAVAARTPNIEQCVLISAPYSLVDVLAIWSRGFMRLSKKIEDRIFAELLEMNGVPVQHWTIGLHSKNLDMPTLVIHDENDPIVDLSHLSRIANAFRSSSTKVTKGFGHIKILSNKDVLQEAADFVSMKNESTLGEAIA